MGIVNKEIIQEIAKLSPEVANSIQTYNQIKGYLDQGAQISNELGVDEKGEVNYGTIVFKDKEENFGNLVGKDLKIEDISGKQVQLEKKAGISTITFTERDSSLKIKGNSFENIQPKDNLRSSNVQLNEKGEITHANFWTNEKGGDYTIGNEIVSVPPNSHVFYSGNLIKIDVMEDSELKELPHEIENPNPNIVSNEIDITGKNIKLSNGNVLQQGTIVYNKGKTYLAGYDVQIDHLLLGNIVQNQRIFFDGLSHVDAGEDYISLNSNTQDLYILSRDQKLDINFDQGNPFVNLNIKENNEDFGIITQNRPHQLELSIHNPEGEIPKLNVKTLNGASYIFNGDFGIDEYDKTLFIKPTQSQDNKNAVPLDIKFQESNLLSNKKILLFNKDNSWAILRVDNPSLKEYTSLDYQDVPLDEKQTELITRIGKLTPWIEYNGLEHLYHGELQQLSEQMNLLPESLTSRTTSISFLPKEEVDPENLNIGGYSDTEGSVIINYNNFDSSVLVHECTHSRDFYIRNLALPTEFYSEGNLKSYMALQLNEVLIKNGINYRIDSSSIKYSAQEGFDFDYEYYSKINNLPDKVFNEMLDAYEKTNRIIAAKSSPFIREWLGIQNEDDYTLPLGTYSLELPPSEFAKASEWPDGTSGPRACFVMPYGKVNVDEDVATFVEKIIANPSFFKIWSDPKSQQYNPYCFKKIGLLNKYGFINDEQYSETMGM